MLALVTVLFVSILFLVCLPVIINILTLNEVEIIEDDEINKVEIIEDEEI